MFTCCRVTNVGHLVTQPPYAWLLVHMWLSTVEDRWSKGKSPPSATRWRSLRRRVTSPWSSGQERQAARPPPMQHWTRQALAVSGVGIDLPLRTDPALRCVGAPTLGPVPFASGATPVLLEVLRSTGIAPSQSANRLGGEQSPDVRAASAAHTWGEPPDALAAKGLTPYAGWTG